jgi:phage/plasmid-like protein (TIGR03299 family)
MRGLTYTTDRTFSMDLFSDILQPLPTTTPLRSVVEQVAATLTSRHHPVAQPPSRAPQTSRLGLPVQRQNPWQRNGHTLVGEGTTDPTIAIRQAGLDWSVSRIDLRTADTLDPVPDFAAIRRSDTGKILGVVGPDYEPFQNAGMFQVFSDLAQVDRGDGGLPFTIETAGAFQAGKVVWALAHLPDLGIRIGDDESKTYLLVSNGHTGNRTLIISATTIRVICRNSLRMAEAQARYNRNKPGLAGGFTLKHTPGIHAAVNEAKAAFAATIASHATTKAAWNRLADIPLTSKLEAEFMASVFGKPGPDETDRAKSLRKSREERLAAILASPTSQVKGTKDSLFSVMQAVVEYADHDRTTRTAEGGDADESRLFSATFGSGAELKAKAWDAALEMAA